MTQRITTRIGDIFCAEDIDGKHKRYFQYIARDLTELNSQVGRFFKRKYPIGYNPSMEEIVNDKIDFYSHLTFQQGLKDGSWYKVGKCKDIGNVNEVQFRWCGSIYAPKAYNWYIWNINKDIVHIGEATREYKKISLGGVYPTCDIMHKLRTGKYTWGEDIL